MSYFKDALDFMQPIIIGGRTRLLVAILGLCAIVAVMYFTPDGALYYLAGICVIVVSYMISKTWTDIKQGPANHERCKEEPKIETKKPTN